MNGFLDKDETKSFMRDTMTQMGEDLEQLEPEFDACFKEFDIDGDGVITKEEFVDFMRKITGI